MCVQIVDCQIVQKLSGVQQNVFAFVARGVGTGGAAGLGVDHDALEVEGRRHVLGVACVYI